MIDLVIQYVAGITHRETGEILIDPIDMGCESFSLTNVRYRNHDIDVEFTWEKGITVRIDGVVKARTPCLKKVVITTQ